MLPEGAPPASGALCLRERRGLGAALPYLPGPLRRPQSVVVSAGSFGNLPLPVIPTNIHAKFPSRRICPWLFFKISPTAHPFVVHGACRRVPHPMMHASYFLETPPPSLPGPTFRDVYWSGRVQHRPPMVRGRNLGDGTAVAATSADAVSSLPSAANGPGTTSALFGTVRVAMSLRRIQELVVENSHFIYW